MTLFYFPKQNPQTGQHIFQCVICDFIVSIQKFAAAGIDLNSFTVLNTDQGRRIYPLFSDSDLLPFRIGERIVTEQSIKSLKQFMIAGITTA